MLFPMTKTSLRKTQKGKREGGSPDAPRDEPAWDPVACAAMSASQTFRGEARLGLAKRLRRRNLRQLQARKLRSQKLEKGSATPAPCQRTLDLATVDLGPW